MATAINTGAGWGLSVQVGPEPYEYLVIDIETGAAPDKDVKEYFEKTYRCPRNIKDPEKKKANREKAWASAQEMASVHPLAPVIAIGLKSPKELRCLHAMKEHPPATRMGGLVEGFASAEGMLQAFASLLAARVMEETVLGGFNIRDFDLPAIRRMLARLKLGMPNALLNPDQPMFDNMHKYARLFSGEKDIMISAPEVSMGLGIEPHRISGAVVPELYAAGEFEAVIDKVLLDVCEEEQQLLRMTGRR
jgi:hypothetical protein